MTKLKFLALAIALMCGATQLSAKDYQVSDFGAKADGITLNTNMIQRAIDAVNERGGGRLVFGPGKYLTGTIYLKKQCNLAPRTRRGSARFNQSVRLCKRSLCALDGDDLRYETGEHRHHRQGNHRWSGF